MDQDPVRGTAAERSDRDRGVESTANESVHLQSRWAQASVLRSQMQVRRCRLNR